MAYKIDKPTCEPLIIWDNYITHMFLWECPELHMACICIYIYMCVIPSETVFAVYKYIHLFIYLSIYLSVYLPVYLSVYLSVYVSVYLSVYVSVYLSVCLSVCLSYLILSYLIYRSIDLSIYRSIDLSIYRSIDLSIYRSIDLSIYLSIYLSQYFTIIVVVIYTVYILSSSLSSLPPFILDTPVHEIMTDPREEHLVGILPREGTRHSEIRSSLWGGETTKNKKQFRTFPAHEK